MLRGWSARRRSLVISADPQYIDVFSLPPPPRAADFTVTCRMLRRKRHAVSLVVFGVGLAIAAWHWLRAEAIDGAAPATARILAKETSPGRRHVHYVRFAFTPKDAQEIEIKTEVEIEQYDSVSVGQEMPVHYLLENPSGANWLFGYREARQQAYQLAVKFLVCCSVAPLLFVGLMEWPTRRERNLARRGELTTGHITEAGTSTGAGSLLYQLARAASFQPIGKTCWIRFQFPLASGQVGSGKSYVPKAYFEAKGRPGEAVAVLWDARRPRRCQALPGLRFTAFPSADKKGRQKGDTAGTL